MRHTCYMVKLRRANPHFKVLTAAHSRLEPSAPTSEPHLPVPDSRTLLMLQEIKIPQHFVFKAVEMESGSFSPL